VHPDFAGGIVARTRFLLVPRRNDNALLSLTISTLQLCHYKHSEATSFAMTKG
jgi:hypothetical protein